MLSFALGCGRAPDAYEPDNSCSMAKPLAVGETQRRTIHMKRDRDWMRVQVEAGRRDRFRVSGVTGSAPVRLSLYPSCNGVERSTGGAGRNRFFDWQADRSGAVFLHTICDKPTAYEISVTEQPGS